jgi:hypothetical protein
MFIPSTTKNFFSQVPYQKDKGRVGDLVGEKALFWADKNFWPEGPKIGQVPISAMLHTPL